MHTQLAEQSRSPLPIGPDVCYARLLEENARKDVFMATLAHELRNLIWPLSCALELLERGGSDPQSVGRALPVARRQVRHMRHLVSDLLDVGRILRGEVPLEATRLALSTVVSETLEACAPLLARHVLSIDLGREPLWVHADAVRLSQVVTNLLHNAAKFCPAGGAIWVQLDRVGDQAVLHVRDSGQGIAAEHLQSIFGLFAQVPRDGRMGDGLGIGLALARRLAELHGGSVEASSDGPGRGAVFTVSLPLAAEVA